MELRFEQSLALPVETVFAFFANPAHLPLLMADWPKFRLLAHAPRVCLGDTIWFEVTIAGCITVVLGFRHTRYEPPSRFGADLLHGPFRTFEHILEF
jgi:ligand-binding SRPBCC domain-containing protein